VVDDVFAHVITDGVGIPGGPAQQVLHGVRAGFPGPLCDRPAVLAQQFRQRAEHRPPGPQPRFVSGEPVGDPAMATSNAGRGILGEHHISDVVAGISIPQCPRTYPPNSAGLAWWVSRLVTA
jgi:hypothetical protein